MLAIPINKQYSAQNDATIKILKLYPYVCNQYEQPRNTKNAIKIVIHKKL